MFAPDISPTLQSRLIVLLDHLDSVELVGAERWDGWLLRPVSGGWNNLIYRVTDGESDLAIKYSVVDERDRAGREYQALTALKDAGLEIAPSPICLDRRRWRQPVVVQRWLHGPVSTEPPVTDSAWDRLLENLAHTHSVTPEYCNVPVEDAVLTAFNSHEALRLIDQQVARIPVTERQPAMQALVDRCRRATFPVWPRPAAALCRVDCAIQNFIQRSGIWAAVDWENAGWGDPAFEIADLISHAAHVTVPAWRGDWIAQRYAELVSQPEIVERIQIYRQIQAVWWVVRTSRYLYEIPRGLDPRLANLSGNWMEDIRQKHEHYLAMAERLFLEINE